jgi:hypothetical protein
MNIKLLHIGLPKSGSTYLQKEIFPKLSKHLDIANLELNQIIDERKICFHPFENKTNIEKKFPNNFILSNENIFSHKNEFSRVLRSFEILKKNFSKDTIILLILRDPYEYLNSFYIESVQTMFRYFQEPKNFFYIENTEIIRKSGKYNLYNFNYKYLVDLYKSYFSKVVVVKFEELNSLMFLKKIFEIDDRYINYLKNNSRKIHNRAISKTAIKIIFFLNKFINLNKNQNYIKSLIKPSNNKLLKFRNKLLSIFLIRVFFQKIFDNIFPYKKYYINKAYIPINIDKLTEEYNNSNY